MSVPIIDLEIDQGDDERILITSTVPDDPTDPNSSRSRIDLTSCILSFAVRTSAAVEPILAKSTGSGILHADQTVDATKGQATLSIPGSDTAALDPRYTGRTMSWELRVVDGSGKTTTLAKGSFLINRDLVS